MSEGFECAEGGAEEHCFERKKVSSTECIGLSVRALENEVGRRVAAVTVEPLRASQALRKQGRGHGQLEE